MNRHPHWITSATLLVALAASAVLLAMGEPADAAAADLCFTAAFQETR